MPDRGPLVSVVIVNYNGMAFLEQCLSSIRSQTYPWIETIVVDNASRDGSHDIARQFPGVRLLMNRENLGFAEGCNQGIRMAAGEFIAMLNNDAIAAPGWVASLVNAMRPDEHMGMCASKMLFMKRPDMINSTGICVSRSGACWDRGMFEPDKGQYESPGEVFGPCGGAALYRKSMLDEVGAFDRDFFAYMEDADLAFRARAAGWKCLYVPTAVVYHYGNGSAGYMSDFSIYQGNRNIVWNFIKNYHGLLLLKSLPWVVGRNIGVIPYYALRGHGAAILKAKVDAAMGIPRMLARRGKRNASEIERFIMTWADIPKSPAERPDAVHKANKAGEAIR